MLINENTWQFIRKHANDDVRKLALQGTKNADVDLPMALQQIAGRQTARRKLPAWAAAEDVLYPPHLNMEQCSSEQTARYKQQLVEHLQTDKRTFIDLTGGFGVDFYWMSQGFSQRHYVEQHAELCAVAEHNFAHLSLPCSVHNSDSTTFLSTIEGNADIIYLDPARRNEHGGRTYGIADCTPNVLDLLPLLLEKTRFIVLKLSPMLDWRKAVSDLQEAAADCRQSHAIVSEVHIVSVGNECKELLLDRASEGGLHQRPAGLSSRGGAPCQCCHPLPRSGASLCTMLSLRTEQQHHEGWLLRRSRAAVPRPPTFGQQPPLHKCR